MHIDPTTPQGERTRSGSKPLSIAYKSQHGLIRGVANGVFLSAMAWAAVGCLTLVLR